MYFSLAPGLLGIKTTLAQTLELAARTGFEGVDASASQLAGLSHDTQALSERFSELNLRPGYFALEPVVVSAPDAEWSEGLERLKRALPSAQKLGCTRAIAVVLPFSETLPFAANFAFHVKRLRVAAGVLEQGGIALGLEYVAPLTRRAPYQHHFVHNLEGMLELIAATGVANVGLLLDSFHWFCAAETPASIAALSASQIVAVHLNDAIKGRPRDEQVAFERELPGESGEIDLAGFLNALRATGYDGPLTCEPMNKALNELGDEVAALRTIAALRKTVLQTA